MSSFKKIFSAFTRAERIAFVIAAGIAVLSFIVVMSMVLAGLTKAVPAAGGEYTEGMIGQPEYVNPVIATSPTDLDLVKMVYSNVNDIAASVDASPDLRTWTVRLNEGLTWQDGEKLTADDVVFTVQSVQDENANSPLFQSWQGVAVTRESELEVQFSLANPYAFFADNLKGLYIIPKHIFADTPTANWKLSDYNLKPVGSGPYKFVSYDKDANGFISAYHLESWDGSANGQALIKNFDFDFFNDENALIRSFNAGTIDAFGNATPEDLSSVERPYNTFSWPTTGYYAVFFNQSKNLALQDPAVREALSLAVNRSDIVNQALGGHGEPETGPIPPGAPYFSAPGQSNATSSAASTTSATSSSLPAADPSAILDAAGWTVGTDGFRSKTIQNTSVPLMVNLTVPQIDFLAKTADYLRTAWQAIGIQVNVTPDSLGDIANNEIKNRDYEALLFGNVLGPSSDLYSFWDSSERFYPGLNLAIYDNPKLDPLIESARQTTDDGTRAAKFAQAQAYIMADYPAVFLYSPDFIYITNKNVQGVVPSILSDQSDRFRNAGTWYLNTTRVLQ